MGEEETENDLTSNDDGDVSAIDIKYEDDEEVSENSSAHTIHDKEKISIQKIGEKKFKCGQCPYVSYNKGHLKQHIAAVHDKIKSHVCGDCSYASSCKGNLNRHREYVHTKGDVKFKCDQCPYKSISKGSLKGHKALVHGKIKNHVCAECGYAASSKKHLNQHTVSVHKYGNQKYDCDRCPMRYKGESGLRNHVNSYHLKQGV